MEKYLPIQIQNSISDSIKIITTGNSFRQYTAFENIRVKEMYSTIVDDDGNPQKEISELASAQLHKIKQLLQA